MSQRPAAMFTFTLSGSGSIGPKDLQELWMRASGQNAVRVTRRAQAGQGKPVYTLYAAQTRQPLQDVRQHLCSLLEARQLKATVSTVGLPGNADA